MLKIVKSIVTIVAVAAIATTATGAYFSDTETSNGNSFTSGSLNLAVDGQDGSTVTTKYTIANWKPGDNRNIGQVKVKNTGSLSGRYWVEIKNVVNNENGQNDSEISSGDTTSGVTDGELGAKVSGYLQENTTGYYHLNPSITNIDSAQGVAMVPSDGGVLAPNEEVPIVFYAKWLSTASDNQAQGDSVTFDLVFHLDQV